MKPFKGYEPKKIASREPLPAGGYVVKILDAKEINYDWGSTLLISFDVAEGEYKDFFRADFKTQDREDKKWRGTYRLFVPNDDGSEKDEWTKKTFNGAIFALEDSNKGFHWDWDEKKLKDLTVGALYRNKEWAMEDRTGWTTECAALICASDIRDNKFKIPKDKPLKNKPAQAQSIDIEIDEEDLPF